MRIKKEAIYSNGIVNFKIIKIYKKEKRIYCEVIYNENYKDRVILNISSFKKIRNIKEIKIL